jgi:hypothetical protein
MKWGSFSDFAAAYFSASPPPLISSIIQNPAYGAPSALLIQSQIAALVAQASLLH